MSGYRLPSTTDWVTDDWQDHKDRNSGMPGTDYGTAYGEPAYAVEDGKVTVAVKSTSSANGRYIGILLDDGRETWCLHLSVVSVSVGQRVTRGQKIGETGASGYGDDWYYGPHIHQSLWPDDAWDDPTIDFEKYVGDPDEEGNMSTLKTVNTPFEAGQVVGTTETYLYINADHDVSVAIGPYEGVWGALYVSFDTLIPPSEEGSTFQVRAVVETYEDGKVTASSSLGTQEFIYTAGKTLGFVTVPPFTLASNKRLRFKALTYNGAQIKMSSIRYRGATVK